LPVEKVLNVYPREQTAQGKGEKNDHGRKKKNWKKKISSQLGISVGFETAEQGGRKVWSKK